MELELISAVMADPRQLEAVSAIVQDRDFLDPVNRRVWRALRVLIENNVPTNDVAALAAELKAAGLTIRQIADLVGMGIAASAEYYARKVRDAGRRVRCSERIQEALERLGNDAEDTNSVLDALEALCSDERLVEGSNIISIGEAAREYARALKSDDRAAASVYTGISAVDTVVGGFGGGEMVIVAARPGMGKTSFAMQVAQHNAAKGRPGLFVSLEMTSRELVGRVLCGIADVDNRAIRAGAVSDSDREAIDRAASEVEAMGIWIWDPASAKIGEIMARARLAGLKYGIGWMMLDYVQLIDGGRESRREAIGRSSQSLKRLAKELGIPVFVLAQLNRDSEKEKRAPRLSDLKDSGDIEQDADAVLFLHEEEGTHCVVVGKHRHGERGKIEVTFDGSRTMFGSPPTFAPQSNVYETPAIKVAADGTWMF